MHNFHILRRKSRILFITKYKKKQEIYYIKIRSELFNARNKIIGGVYYAMQAMWYEFTTGQYILL